MTRASAVVALLVLTTAGCGDGAGRSEGASNGPCLDGGQQAGVIAERLVGGATSLGAAQAVALDPPYQNYFYVVAAEIQGTDGQIGVWATGSWLGGARVMALDENARRWSDWGTAISEESPAGRQRSRLARRAEVDRVRGCVGSAPEPA